MSEKRQIVDLYKDTVPVSQLNKWISMSRSNYYYKVKPGKRGRKPTTYTLKKDNSVVTNTDVINTLVREVYETEEFNRYGYLLSTCELKDLGFIINHKKVYRLMKASGLLLFYFIQNMNTFKSQIRSQFYWKFYLATFLMYIFKVLTHSLFTFIYN